MNRHPLHALPLTALLLGGLLSAGAPVWAAQPAAKAESSAKAAAKGSEEKTAEEHPGAEPGKTQTLKESGNYTVTAAPSEPLHLEPPKLPDLSGYTAEAVEKKIERKKPGRAHIERMVQQQPLKEFTGGKNRLAEWVKRQRQMPRQSSSTAATSTSQTSSANCRRPRWNRPSRASTSPACPSSSARARPWKSTARSRNCGCPRTADRSWSTTASCSCATPRSPPGTRRKTNRPGSRRPTSSAPS